MSSPIVSAIVLNYQSPQQTVACVLALSRQLQATSYKLQAGNWLEIIVVDNHSDDDSIGVLRNRLQGFPTVRIVETRRNIGFGRGYNLGARAAQGRYLLINNPAKVLEPGAIQTMVEAMEADPTIGILGPRLLYDDGETRDSARSFPTLFDVVAKRTALRRLVPGRMRRYLRSDADPALMSDTDWLIGGCLMIRHDLWERLKGFDEHFFLFFEDMDLCRRCWRCGKRVVYFPQARASDRKRRLSEGSALLLPLRRVGRAHIASAVKYFWKWRRPQAARLLVSG